MNIFRKMPLQYKFLLSVLCLVAGVLLFVGTNWHEKREAVRQTEQLEAFSALMVYAGGAVRELQKEQALSTKFLASTGTKQDAELTAQKQRSAEQTALLATALEGAGERLFHGDMSGDLQKRFGQGLALLKNVSPLQDAVAAQKMAVKEAFDQYAGTSAAIFDLLVDLVHAQQVLLGREPRSGVGIGLVGWVLMALGLLLVGLVARSMASGDREGSNRSGSAPVSGEWTTRWPRVVGLHAGSITACAAELISIRNLVHTDASNAQAVAASVAEEATRLGAEIYAVKQSIEQASDNIMAISAASQQLSDNIGAIATASERASNNISTVASAAEEITANISGVNQSLSQVDQSLQNVTLSTRGMTSSLEEVRKRCLLASRESDQVNQHALGSRSIMTELSESARAIGDVVEIINSIAEQTNMLALNASIEAAGAGDAGKGFAVVANEVKELARQTGKATQLIAQKADNIQQQTDLAAEANTEITNGIGRITHGNAEITQAVDEQAATIQGIAKAMNTVSEASAEVTRNTQELNLAAQDVAKAALEAANSTTAIARAAAEGASGSVDVAQGSGEALALATAILTAAQNTEQASDRVQAKMVEATQIAVLLHGSASYLNQMGTILQQTTNALYVSQIEMETGAAPFNIRELKSHILHWHGVLEQKIYGRQEMAEQGIPQQGSACPVCQWLTDQEQSRLGAESVFQDVVATHKKIHDAVNNVTVLLAKSDREQARAQLGQFHSARVAFFRMLDTLYLGAEVAQQEAQPFLPWSDQLSVGIQEVDDDHKRLVAMVNHLHRTMKEGSDSAALAAILKEAAEYTTLHFGREEGLMRRHHYPELASQEAEHKQMVKQLIALATRFQQGEFPVAMDIMAFAKVWLTRHILGSDMKLKVFFAQKKP